MYKHLSGWGSEALSNCGKLVSLLKSGSGCGSSGMVSLPLMILWGKKDIRREIMLIDFVRGKKQLLVSFLVLWQLDISGV